MSNENQKFNFYESIANVFNESSNENILKSFLIKNHLCPEIFEKSKNTYNLKNKIKNALLKISDDFVESCNVEFEVKDIILTGSLANYNWSKYSDVDLHILIDYDEIDEEKNVMQELFDAKKNVWNENHDVKIKGFDVEIYVQDANEQHTSSGIYSVLNDEWIIEPKQENPMIDKKKIMHKANEYMNKIDKLQKLHKKEDVYEKIEKLRGKIKKLRQTGLDKEGEFSYENLTFKLLRRNGYIEKLMNLRKQISDRKLSVKETNLSVKETTDIVRMPIQPEQGGPIMGSYYK